MLPAEEVEEEIESNVKDTRADNEVSVEDERKEFYTFAQRNRFKAKRSDVTVSSFN